jgi:hypothetical protein
MTEIEAVSLSMANDGFAIVPQVITAEEIHLLLGSLEGLPAHRSRAGVRHLLNNPAVGECATDRRMLGIAQSVLGGMLFLSKPLSLISPKTQTG